MAKRRPKEFIVRRSDQVRALSSPLRQSIVDALRRMGKGSIREIAQELGRVPATLYYHLRQLEDAKLVNEVEKRETARRPEAVYALVADQLRLDRQRSGPAWNREVDRLVRTHLRSIERALLRNLQLGEEHSNDLAPLAQLRVHRSRLGEADRQELQRRLLEVTDFVSEAAERAKDDDPVLSLLLAYAPSPDAEIG